MAAATAARDLRRLRHRAGRRASRAMNLYLHGIGGDDRSPIQRADALLADPGARCELGADQPALRRASRASRCSRTTARWTPSARTTSATDFQVDDLEQAAQFPAAHHDRSWPRTAGRRGAARQRAVRGRRPARASGSGCSTQFDFHTLLRLPTGIFYKHGVKANVLFFDKQPPQRRRRGRRTVWIYDFRTNQSFTLKERPLKRADLDEFVSVAKLSPATRAAREPNASAASAMTSSSSATSSTSTSSGSRTTASTTRTACRRRTRSRPRSSRAWRQPWIGLGLSLRSWPKGV